MLKQLFNGFSKTVHSTAEAEEVRRQMQSIFFKIKNYQKYLKNDSKLKFNVLDTSTTDEDLNTSGQITYFLGGYAIRYELDDMKTIQLFRRGRVDNLQFCELLAISFFKRIEYIADELFVKSDIYQLEILVNHVIKSRNKKF